MWESVETKQSEIMSTTITANTRKLIASLRQAKYRRKEGMFVIEGTRAVLDTIEFFDVCYLVCTAGWLSEHGSALPKGAGVMLATNQDMERMSSLTTPQGVLAVCRIPDAGEQRDFSADELVIALDTVQDPGNLGTIIRVADWFGVTRIIASEKTVDVWNSKVIQASMGAIARVKVEYCNLVETLSGVSNDVAVYGTFLDGGDFYDSELTTGGIIVMGNEGNGISREVGTLINRRIKIPPFPPERQTVESLNVSMATGIVLSEFRRRALQKR